MNIVFAFLLAVLVSLVCCAQGEADDSRPSSRRGRSPLGPAQPIISDGKTAKRPYDMNQPPFYRPERSPQRKSDMNPPPIHRNDRSLPGAVNKLTQPGRSGRSANNQPMTLGSG